MEVLNRLLRHFCRRLFTQQSVILYEYVSMYNNTADQLQKIVKISAIMWINTSNEGIWKICAKPPFLHSLDVPIKMFTNSLAVLHQKTLERTDRIHCFQILQILLIESCLVVWFQVDKSLWFPSLKKVWICRLDSGLMVSGIYLKFIFYSKKFSNYFFVVRGQGGAHQCTRVHERLFEAQKM